MTVSSRLDASDAALVPGWLRRLAALSWRALVALGLGAVLVLIALKLSMVTIAIVIGAIVAAALAPFVRRLEVARGWSSTRASIVVCAAAVLVAVAGVILLVLAFAPDVANLIALIQQGEAAIADWFTSLGLPPHFVSFVHDLVDAGRVWIAGALTDFVVPLANLVSILVLAAFLVFFSLQGGERAWNTAGKRMAPWRAQILFDSGRDALSRVGGYLRGTAILAFSHAITDFVYLTLLGVPLAGPIAVLIFFLTFIPYVGGILGVLIVVLAAAATVGGAKAVLLFLLVSATNIVVNSILRPMVYGRTIKLHPALVLVALPTGAALFGITGLFIALPTLAFVMAIVPGFIKVLSTGPETGEAQAANPLVPLWLERLGAWSWRALAIIGMLAVLLQVVLVVPLVVTMLILALVFAATLQPVTTRLRARGMHGTAAAIVATGGLALVIVLIMVLSLASVIDDLPPMFDSASAGAEKTGVGQLLLDFIRAFRSGLVATLGDLISTVSQVATGLFLGAFLTFYILRDGERWGGALLADIDNPIRRTRLQTVGREAIDVLSGYMTATSIVSAVGAVSQWAIMFFLGLPLAVPLAVLSFFGGFVPYIGSALTTGLAFLVTIAVGSQTDVLVMAVFTIIFNIVQGNIVAPIVYSRAVHVHPAVVLMSVPAGAALAGVVGMFLAVPFLGVVAITWSAVLHSFDPDDDLLPSPPDAGPDGGPSPSDLAGPVPIGPVDASNAEAGA